MLAILLCIVGGIQGSKGGIEEKGGRRGKGGRGRGLILKLGNKHIISGENLFPKTSTTLKNTKRLQGYTQMHQRREKKVVNCKDT